MVFVLLWFDSFDLAKLTTYLDAVSLYTVTRFPSCHFLPGALMVDECCLIRTHVI